MIAPGDRVLVAVVGRQGLARRVGPPPRPRLRRPTGSTSASASATTATPPATTPVAFAERAGPHPGRGRPARRATATTSPPAPGPPGGRRARPAGCRSATCSTRRPSTAATTCWSPATTSTTRPPCCSATCCTGRPSTSAASCPVLPARDGFPRKVKPLVRLGERETAAYCVLRGIDYLVEECPMAAGNRHLGYKEALNDIEAQLARRQAPTSTSASCAGPRTASERRGGARTGTALRRLRPLRGADPRRGVRLLPAGRSGRATAAAGGARPASANVAEHRRATGDVRPASPRATGPAHRRQEPPLPGHARSRASEFHSHAGFVRPRRRHRPARGRHRAVHPRARPYIVVRPTLSRLRAQDAARRAGHLPEGPRPDPDAGRHLPGRPRARVGCRVGRAVDGACCGPGPTSSATSCARTSPTGPRRTWSAFLGDGGARPLPGRAARLLRRHRRDRPRPGRARPARAVAGREARRAGAAPRRHPPRLHAVDHPGRAAPRGPRGQRLRHGRDRSRCSTAAGTSRARPSGPTTAWSPTPASSPTPACGA